MDFLGYLFWFLVILGAVVFIHEFGHYIFARIFGVRVEVFSIGFGKEIFGWNDSNGTRWKVSIMPLGGYVKMFGDQDPSSTFADNADALSDADRKLTFFGQNVFKRFAIVFAGPLFNYLSAIIIMMALFLVYGKVYTSNEVAGVLDGSPAQISGIKSGDKIIAINAKNIDSFEQMRQIIAIDGIMPLHISIERDGLNIDLLVHPVIKVTKDVAGNKIDIPFVGISSHSPSLVELGLYDSLKTSFYESYHLCIGMLSGIKQIVLGQRGIEQLGGPVKIAKYSGESAKAGVIAVMWFIVIISLNLAMMNLLPLPMLDGGHLVYYFIEMVTGKKVNNTFQQRAANVTMAMLFFLMIIITYHDIIGLIK